MICLTPLRRLRADSSGSTIIEFGILAPTILAAMFGVVQVGNAMWNYNSMRAIAADTVRYTVVEYQKGTRATTSQIQTKAVAIAVNQPYNFNINNLTVDVTNPTSDVTGMTKYQIAMTYSPPNFLSFVRVVSPTLTFTRPIYVSST